MLRTSNSETLNFETLKLVSHPFFLVIWSILFSHMRDRARRMAAREERRKYGQSLRQKVGRVSHADWDPKHRKISILELLHASEHGRLANLLPIKAARMAASPFGFYRGAVPIMASDLSIVPLENPQRSERTQIILLS
jgi:hypothetical protein